MPKDTKNLSILVIRSDSRSYYPPKTLFIRGGWPFLHQRNLGIFFIDIGTNQRLLSNKSQKQKCYIRQNSPKMCSLQNLCRRNTGIRGVRKNDQASWKWLHSILSAEPIVLTQDRILTDNLLNNGALLQFGRRAMGIREFKLLQTAVFILKIWLTKFSYRAICCHSVKRPWNNDELLQLLRLSDKV